MLRGTDNKGNAILGITRREIEGLLAGERCCFPTRPELGGGPHICLWFAETDAELLGRLHEMYPDGMPRPIDYRTKAPLAEVAPRQWRTGVYWIHFVEPTRAEVAQCGASYSWAQCYRCGARHGVKVPDDLGEVTRAMRLIVDAHDRCAQTLAGARWELTITLRMRQWALLVAVPRTEVR